MLAGNTSNLPTGELSVSKYNFSARKMVTIIFTHKARSSRKWGDIFPENFISRQSNFSGQF